MNTKEYNGWTNYETWLIKLWIDNDQGSQEYWREQARNVSPNHAGPVSNLANDLKAQHEDNIHDVLESANPPQSASFIADLLNAAMSEVNWREIAESLIRDYCEDCGRKITAA